MWSPTAIGRLAVFKPPLKLVAAALVDVAENWPVPLGWITCSAIDPPAGTEPRSR